MEVTRGQRWTLQGSMVDVTFNLDVEHPHEVAYAALLLDAEGRAVAAPVEDGGTHGDGYIAPVPQRAHAFRVTLDHIPARVDRIMFVAALDPGATDAGVTLRVVRGGRVVVHDGAGDHALQVEPSELHASHAVSCIELYRKAGWRAWHAGSGWSGDATGALARFGTLAGRWPARRVAPHPSRLPVPERSSPAALGRATLPTSPPGRVQPQLPSGLTQAVAMVLVETATGRGNGTAFFVTPGGLAVTCAHVVNGARNVALITDGESRARSARVVAVDDVADLALVAPEDVDGAPDWLLLAPAGDPRGLGLEIGVFGYPLGNTLGLTLTYSQGVVNSARSSGGNVIYQLDAGAAPGSSGGPVFRRSDGRVIGVLTSGLRDQPAGMLVNFAVDIERMRTNGWVA